MSWLGQHIWGFISRFRNKIYIESIETGTSIKVLVRETDGQIKEKDCRCASGDEVQEVKGVEPVSVDNTDPKKPVVSVNDASRTNTGLMSSSDKDKLDGLPNGDTYTTTINGINKGISDNTAVILLNQTNITSNADDITTLTANQTDLITKNKTNSDNIAAQTTKIQANEQGIKVNSNNIATNVTNITTNTTNIASNTTNIASNSTKIKTNEESIASNSALGANNATTINTIATKVSSVEADVAKNGTTIANNTTAIATNTTAIATKQGTITLTTTGTSGAATLGSKGVLNIPQYAATTTGLSGTFTVLEDVPEKGEKTYAQITLSNGVITRIISVTADQRVDNNLTSPSRE